MAKQECSDMNTPKSLQALAGHQTAYQELLRQQPYYRMVQPIVEGFLRQIINHGAFYLRVHVASLEGILESKSIKSVMETGKGATNGGMDTRREVTEALFGCNAKKLLPSEFPKYGFLSQPDALKDLYVNGGMWCQYGDVSIQLKKYRLFHRTTLCVGDSVNFGRCYQLIPTRVDDVKATCICGLSHDGDPLMKMGDPMAAYAIFAQWILEKKLTINNFPLIEEVAKDVPPIFDFFELQYHGELDITQDVERIDIAPSSPEENEKLLGLKEKFEAIGVKFNIFEGGLL